MYDLMRDIGRSEAVSGSVEELLATGVPVQGLHIGVDEFYAEWYYSNALNWWYRNGPRRYYSSRHLWSPVDVPDEVRREMEEARRTIPDWWSRYAARTGQGEASLPFYIRIILREPESRSRGPDAGRRTDRQRGRAQQRPARIAGLRVVYEERPPTVALAGSISPTLMHGDGVTGSGPVGTCGGALQDSSTGRKYGVTCLHVLPQSSSVQDASGGQRIGRVRAAGSLVPTPTGGYCNSRSVHGAGSTDWSVFEFDPGVSVQVHQTRHGRIIQERPIATIGPYLNVEFTGVASGLRECQTGSVGIWHEVLVDGVPHCFGDIFQLKWRPGTLFSNRRSSRDLVQHRDSGAWVVDDHQGRMLGTDWLGMVVAGDGADGYASFGEEILGDVRGKLGSGSLSLLL